MSVIVTGGAAGVVASNASRAAVSTSEHVPMGPEDVINMFIVIGVFIGIAAVIAGVIVLAVNIEMKNKYGDDDDTHK